MTFDTFVSDFFLKFTFLFVFIGIIVRFIFFVNIHIVKNNEWKFFFPKIIFLLLRLLFPLHNSIKSKPLISILINIFHLCLIIVPIWYSGHIILWTISRFGWYWTPLPTNLIDWMTILVIALLIFFLLRKIFIPSYRRFSTFSDYFLIIIVLLPFLTGYFLTHNFFANVYFFDVYMHPLHIFTSEILLIVSVFLFWKPYINNKCTGCDACSSVCPFDALKYINDDNNKYILFNHYSCIGCGACYDICPEDAIKLKHNIDPLHFFKFNKKHNIYQLSLKRCELCDTPFATTVQMDKIAHFVDINILKYCPSCRKQYIANQILPK